MPHHEPLDSVQLVFGETQVLGQTHWLEPVLGDLSVALDVNMHRFTSVRAEEDEAVGAIGENGGHLTLQPPHESNNGFRDDEPPPILPPLRSIQAQVVPIPGGGDSASAQAADYPAFHRVPLATTYSTRPLEGWKVEWRRGWHRAKGGTRKNRPESIDKRKTTAVVLLR